MVRRLRDVAEERAHEQQPRRRSNSLPIPKIEVSLYQSPEQKKRGTDSVGDSESKETVHMPDEKEKEKAYLAESSSTGTGEPRTRRTPGFSFVALDRFNGFALLSFPESTFFRRKSSGGEEGSGLFHFRRASEKVKKKMKMADLRAFVETKLLSKSEKTLEKIGRDDPPKPLDDHVGHREFLYFFKIRTPRFACLGH